MMLSQWIALGATVLLMTALVYAFLRKGTAIKPDPENKGRSDQGF